MTTSHRRLAPTLLALCLLLGATACGSEEPAGGAGAPVTLVGQKFTEADIVTELYRQVLAKQGFVTEVRTIGARDLYLEPLQKGEVQVSTDYLSSLTEALNRKANGDDAAPVASPDVTATLTALQRLGSSYGITALRPARAEDANAFAVTREYAERHHLVTLSDLGALGRPVALAAAADCGNRPDCGRGLRGVYGIRLAKVEPLGSGTPETKTALQTGEVQLGQVGTSDGSLDALGLVVLEDDLDWQNAENLVPVVNTAWLRENPRARAALEELSAVLTTADLTALNAEVDGGRLEAGDVANDYLLEKGLV